MKKGTKTSPNPQLTARTILDDESDMEMRKSPQPTIQVIPNQRRSGDQTATIGSRHQQKLPSFATKTTTTEDDVDEIMARYWSGWRGHVLEADNIKIDHILNNVQCKQQDLILLVYLKQASEAKALGRKVLDVNLNVELLEILETDKKKLFLLRLLAEKLNKKMLFARWTLKRYRRMVVSAEEVRRNRKQKVVVHKVVEFGCLVAILEGIISRMQRGAMMHLQDQARMQRLLTSNHQGLGFNSYDQEPEVGEKLQAQDSLDEASRIQSRQRIQSQYSQVSLGQDTSAYSPTDVVATIRRLQNEAYTTQCKFMNHQEKLKKLHFIRWKVAFLNKHLEQLVKKSRQFQLLTTCFHSLKHVSAMQTQGGLGDSEGEPTQEQGRLHMRLRVRNCGLFLSKLKGHSDMKRIAQFSDQIFHRNMLRKAWICFAMSRPHTQSPEQTQSNDTYTQTAPIFCEESRQPQELSRQEETQCLMFRTAHLLTKCYFALKNNFLVAKLARAVVGYLTRVGFESILSHNVHKNNLASKVDRHFGNKNKLVLFRCFRAMKGQVKQNQDLEMYTKCKDKLVLGNSFSALKLGWKQMLVRLKKVGMVRAHIQKLSTLKVISSVLKPSIDLSKKLRELVGRRQQRQGRVFLRCMIKRCIDAKTKQQRVLELRSKLQPSNTRPNSKLEDARYDKPLQYGSLLSEYQRHKAAQKRKNIFWVWMRLALFRKKELITSMEEKSDLDSVDYSAETNLKLQLSSQDHRYWLERYYEQICAFDH